MSWVSSINCFIVTFSRQQSWSKSIQSNRSNSSRVPLVAGPRNRRDRGNPVSHCIARPWDHEIPVSHASNAPGITGSPFPMSRTPGTTEPCCPCLARRDHGMVSVPRTPPGPRKPCFPCFDRPETLFSMPSPVPGTTESLSPCLARPRNHGHPVFHVSLAPGTSVRGMGNRGRARQGKQGFRGPGDMRGMENRVSVVPGVCEARKTFRARHGHCQQGSVVPGVRGMGNGDSVVPGAFEAWETGISWSQGRAMQWETGFPRSRRFRGPATSGTLANCSICSIGWRTSTMTVAWRKLQ
jgi:hypothetical protein